MDSTIRSLIKSRGGYAYEIAGRVVAFFSDVNESREFGNLLTTRAEVAVERCGTQLAFPVTARLNPFTADAALPVAAEGTELRRVFQQPKQTPGRRPEIPASGIPETRRRLPPPAAWYLIPRIAAAKLMKRGRDRSQAS